MRQIMDQSLSPDLVPDPSVSSTQRSHRRGWQLWCGLSLALWGVCATWAWSEESVRLGEPGVLLLEGNRTVTGRITPQGDSYAVEQAAGTLVISKEKVLHVASNLHSIYVHLQDSLPKKPTADDHVNLARWCIGYKLIPEARFELESALETDPSRDDIRRNLSKLDALLKRPLPASEPIKPETPAERLAKGTAGYTVEVESLAGLSRTAGQEYTRRVQPILMHNCTASACHGPLADNTFKLSLVRQGTGVMRSTTEKNLLALLPYIDRESPRSGKLWKLLKTNHGAQGRSIFLGTRGQDQLTAVQDWLMSLSANSDEVESAEVTKQPTSTKIQQTSHHAEQKPRWRKGGPAVKPGSEAALISDAEVHFPPPAAAKGTKPRTVRPAKESSSSVGNPGPDVEPIVSEEHPAEIADLPPDDPFNPDEFNRLQRVKRNVGP